MANKYYNASLDIVNVYMYTQGEVPWFHLDVFTLCEYNEPESSLSRSVNSDNDLTMI